MKPKNKQMTIKLQCTNEDCAHEFVIHHRRRTDYYCDICGAPVEIISSRLYSKKYPRLEDELDDSL